MLNFFTGAFATAAVAAAAGPIIIHLLNRRRFRTVEWAAMDFLREALQRNRKVFQLRDLILLSLRVLAVLLFGLALARPYFESTADELWFRDAWLWLAVFAAFACAIWAVIATSRMWKGIAAVACLCAIALSTWGLFRVSQLRTTGAALASVSSQHPVHAVLVIDNSLSMGYETLDGTLLKQAQARATEFLEDLPAESRVSVVPLCGDVGTFTLDAYRNRDDARDAIGRITVVDRAGSAARAIDLAVQACQTAPELEAKRVVFLGDQQLVTWRSGVTPEALEKLPELQVVQIAPEDPANVSVSDFRLRDGVADAEHPADFLGTVHYSGPHALSDVQVTLSVDDVAVATRTLELQPDQTRELQFPYTVDRPVEPGRPQFVKASLSINSESLQGDRLPNDNQRVLSVPVVAGLPVVFVDQYGSEEDPEQNRYGETYRLRRWLAPRLTRADNRRQLIDIRHISIDEVDVATLENARLVVIAGVERPGTAVPILRQYVRQGGRLIIAAGGDFDPALWSEDGWQSGGGILPVDLEATPFGETMQEASRRETIQPFFLSFRSMQHDYFLIEGEPREFLEDFYSVPLFLKCVQAIADPARINEWEQAEVQRIRGDQAFLKEADDRARRWAEMEQQGLFGETEAALRAQDEARRRELEPAWLLWRNDRLDQDSLQSAGSQTPEQLATQSRPRVLASFAGPDLPFMVERKIGAGNVLLVTTGVFDEWNNLTSTKAILMFERIFRSKITETLPRRNFETGSRVVLRTEPDRDLDYRLVRPSGQVESMSVEAMGPETWGVSLNSVDQGGHYLISAERIVRKKKTQVEGDLRQAAGVSRRGQRPGRRIRPRPAR